MFDDGRFSEDSTFLLNEWIEHTPKAVVAENFRLPPEVFANIHEKDKYIFQGESPMVPRVVSWAYLHSRLDTG